MLRGGDKLTPKITSQMVGGGNQDRRNVGMGIENISVDRQ